MNPKAAITCTPLRISKDSNKVKRPSILSYGYFLLTSSPTPCSRSSNLEQEGSTKHNTSTDDTHHLEGHIKSSTSTSGATSATSAACASRAGGGSRTSSGNCLAGLASKVGAVTLKTRASAGAIIHVLLCVGRHGRQSGRADLPVLGLRRAFGSRAGGLVAAITSRVVGGLESLLKTLEVGVGLDIAARVDLDETVAIGLDGVLVSKTTRVDAGHVGRVESSNLAPVTAVGDAAVLGEKDGLAVVLVELDLLVPARLGEGRGVAPGVVVEGEEVRALVVRAAVEEEGLLLDVLGDIGGGITDRDLTGRPVANVALHVTGNSLDVSGCAGVVALVDDLITGEEEEKVAVVVERVDCGEDRLEVDIVVGAVESGVGLTVK